METRMNSIEKMYIFFITTFFVLFCILSISTNVYAATDNPILVGFSISLSGPFNREGQDQLRGFEVWKDDINKRGGLLGRKVEFKFYDDRSDPANAAKLYEKLITDDKVDLLIGPYGSSVTMAATTVAEKYKMATICLGASSNSIFERGYKYCFQTLTPAKFQLGPVVAMAKKNRYKTVAIINADSAYSRDLAGGALKFAKELGLDVILHEEYPLKAMDLSSLLQKVKGVNPEVFIAGAYVPDSILITRQAKEARFVPKMFSFGPVGPSEPEFTKSLGSDANYIMGVSQWEPTARYPGAKEFVKVFKDRFGEEPSYNSACAFGGGQLVEEAVKRARIINQDKLRDAFAQIETTTVFGAYKVDQTGLQISHQAVVIQVTDGKEGKKKVVWPDEVKEANVILPFSGWR